VDDLNYSTGVRISPNPANETIWINSEEPIQSLQMIDNMGQVVMRQGLLNLNAIQLNIAALPVGIYIIQFETINGQVTRKFVKN